jgi:tRNA pseudouridine55 synthase
VATDAAQMTIEHAGAVREPCLVCNGGVTNGSTRDVEAGRGPIVGILNVDKPTGLTSHDVVARTRQASGLGKVGHAGTLDPAASGVLLVCLGQATRVAEFLMQGRKRYEAEIRLGVTTDTGDAEGRVIRRNTEIDVIQEDVQQALSRFRGRIEQVPPMHSALKHKGTTLYRLARQGIEVERKPRAVEIYDLRLTDWTPPTFRLLVECSKGTYVRALAMDLGDVLGTGAHLQRLVRLACGPYTLEDALSLTEALHRLADGHWRQILHPIDEALLDFEAVIMDGEAETMIRQGQQVRGPEPRAGPFCRAYSSSSGRFVALLQYDEQYKIWQPRKVFNLDEATA